MHASSYAYPYTAYKGFGAPQPKMMLHELSSPGIALYRHAMAGGLGNDPPMPPPEGTPMPTDLAAATGLGMGILAGIILLGVAVNYQIGKAMAPSPESEGKWAWGNAIGGTIFPPVTLGMALYKNYAS